MLVRHDQAKGNLHLIGAVLFIPLALYVFALSVGAQGGLTVNFNNVLQRIDGFGASDRNDSAPMTSTQADALFSPTLGVGLSLLRASIYVDGSYGGGNGVSNLYTNATLAVARGARVWAAPWTAAAAYKDNNNQSNGGNLLVADYANWANILAGFQSTLQSTAGVNLYALSVQNEPDFTANYDSMLYTDAAMAAFIDVLGPKLAALSPVPLLMMPETSNWANVAGYTSSVAGDTTAQSHLGIVAAHQYDGVASPSTAFRPIWQTEMSAFNQFDPSIANGLTVAQWINDALVTGGVSAWHYWGLMGSSAYTDNEALAGYQGSYTPTKRMYVMGNWAKFVRPGFYMVGTSANQPLSGVYVTAFENPSTGAFVVVAVNQNATPTTLGVTVAGISSPSVTPWVTSASLSLVAQATTPIAGGVFSYTLPASSVTSFVGISGPETPPAAPTGLAIR